MINPFSSPMFVMAKPAGSGCNLACDYCYYLEKKKLYDDGKRHLMSDATLERFIRQYIEGQNTDTVVFTWHGGEALLRPIEFYKQAMSFQKQYAAGRTIQNCLQTNGLLLNDAWCKFLHDRGWLVGLSIDGPQTFHDEYRRSVDGRPSFMRVMRAVQLLNKYNVDWNALAVINDYNADYPLQFYKFFKDINCRYIQFTPIVERKNSVGSLVDNKKGGELVEFSVTPQQWGNFLCTVFDEWIKQDVGTYFVQLFDATLANWCGVTPGVCTMAELCGHAGVIEHNGDVYCCDHFVYPEYKLGNIYNKGLAEMMYSDQQLKFGRAKRDSLPGQCRSCKWLFACHGECPKNRFAVTADGESGLNYLCEGYRQFFSHVAPYMDFMKNELDNHRPPANVMAHIDEIKKKSS